MKTRREFLELSAAAALTGVFGCAGVPRNGTRAPLRILMLGGTGFIGPHIIHAALQRGHNVAMLNRGQREPGQNQGDFAKVEAIRGDRTQPTAYDDLKGRTWDAVIDTAQQVPWTRDAVAALKDSTGLYMYISSTGVFTPYLTVDIREDGPVRRADDPPQAQPSYGVMKVLSEDEVLKGFGDRAIIMRPNYIVGPGDTTDRFTYWPVRIARGGEVLVPGRKTDFVQYTDVRDLAEFWVHAIEAKKTGVYNSTGPYPKQTLEQFVNELKPLARTPVTFTWIEDYEWLVNNPVRRLSAAVPWVMHRGNSLGHVQIDNRKAIAAGLKLRPLIETARDTLAWRESDAVPEPIKTTPRYVLTMEQEKALLDAWKAHKRG